MSVIVLADLHGQRGVVNKDTVAGGFGSRFEADSVMTLVAQNIRRFFLRIPSIQMGYLAAIFAGAGHKVVFTQDDRPVNGDLALVLTSLVDYRHECEWAEKARERGIKVGFVGTPATHIPELFLGSADFVISGEPEAAAMELSAGKELSGFVKSPAVKNLDQLPFPRWDLVKTSRFGYTGRNLGGPVRVFPMFTSRSCPEHCTYCPHRITAAFRARSVENIVAEMVELCRKYGRPHIVIRDPLFTLDRERCFGIADAIMARGLKLTFECETRMDDLDEQLIRTLRRAGLAEISFGVESLEPDTLKGVARRFIPHEHMRKMVALCWELGIKTTAFYVFGFLQDTEESIEATIKFACELDTTYTNFKILTPYPGTPLYKQLKPLIVETDWERFDGFTLNFNHPHLTPKRARLMLGMAYSRYLGRPSQLFNLIGLHRYANHPILKKVDSLAFRGYDHFDRPWVSQRNVEVA